MTAGWLRRQKTEKTKRCAINKIDYIHVFSDNSENETRILHTSFTLNLQRNIQIFMTSEYAAEKLVYVGNSRAEFVQVFKVPNETGRLLDQFNRTTTLPR